MCTRCPYLKYAQVPVDVSVGEEHLRTRGHVVSSDLRVPVAKERDVEHAERRPALHLPEDGQHVRRRGLRQNIATGGRLYGQFNAV